MRRPQPIAIEGGIGSDDAADSRGGGDVGNLGQCRIVEIGGDFEEHRDRARQRGPHLHHPGKQRHQRRAALQIAQPFGVGRADIDGGEIDMWAAMAQHLGEIGGTVLGGLVGAEVEADHRALRPFRKPRGNGLHTVIVEPEAVDRRAVLGQAKQPWLGVAGLGQGGCGAHLDKAEAGAGEPGQRGGVLVESGGEAQRVGQRQPGKLGAQARRAQRPGGGRHAQLQRADRQPVGGFRIEPVERPKAQRLEQAHARSSGKTCPPSRQGRSRCQSTSDWRNFL